ncbi:MAG: alkaline phosphatase [Bacteroidales bacterium]|jgi:alkaline phosphatase|nr:alkaline phosphatase [Bacteroidales bacterium]
MKFLSLTLLLILSLTIKAYGQEDYKNPDPNFSFENPSPHKPVALPESVKFKKRPKNIILLIGDGMGVAQVYSALTANKGQLNLNYMKHIGFMQTQSADDYITDSAAAGTAIATGVRVNNGVIAIDQDGKVLKSILYISEDNNKATGLVSTSAITHATPASFVANQPDRGMYEDIAGDFLDSGIDLFIGGGKEHFTSREDGRNLLEELSQNNYRVFSSLEEAASVKTGPMAILTAAIHNEVYPERGNLLPDATQKAIEVLQSNKEGFFLMVEGSQIDWGGHANNTTYIVHETLDFDRAVGKALTFAANNKKTLVIVTADHETGGMSIDNGDISKGTLSAKYTTDDHTGIMVPVFAYGPGAEAFIGIYKNTDLFVKMVEAFGF